MERVKYSALERSLEAIDVSLMGWRHDHVNVRNELIALFLDPFIMLTALLVTLLLWASCCFVWRLQLRSRGSFCRWTWRMLLMFGGILFASVSLTSVEWWLVPPGAPMIKLPSDTTVTTCCRIVYEHSSNQPPAEVRSAFDRAWPMQRSQFGSVWYWRHGIGRLVGKDIGERVPELETYVRIVRRQSYPFSYCVWHRDGRTEALALQEQGSCGISSGDTIILSSMELGVDGWHELGSEMDNRDGFESLFARRQMAVLYSILMAVVLLCALSLKSVMRRPECGPGLHPKSGAILLMASCVLMVMLAVFPLAWLGLVYCESVAGWVASPTCSFWEFCRTVGRLLGPSLSLICAAYGFYRLAARIERASAKEATGLKIDSAGLL